MIIEKVNKMEEKGKIRYYVANIQHIIYVTEIEYTREEFENKFKNLTFIEFA